MDAKLNLYSNGKWVPYNVETTAEQIKYTAPDGSAVTLQEYIDSRSLTIQTLYVDKEQSVGVDFNADDQYRSHAWLVGAAGANGTILTVIPLNLNAVTNNLGTVSGTLNLGSQTISAMITRKGIGYQLLLLGFPATSASTVSICLPENVERLGTYIVYG